MSEISRNSRCYCQDRYAFFKQQFLICMFFYRQKLQRDLFWIGYLNFYHWGVVQVSIWQEQLFTHMPLRLKLLVLQPHSFFKSKYFIWQVTTSICSKLLHEQTSKHWDSDRTVRNIYFHYGSVNTASAVPIYSGPLSR